MQKDLKNLIIESIKIKNIFTFHNKVTKQSCNNYA